MVLQLLVAAILALQAAAQTPPAPAASQPDGNAYVVGATDVLAIRVFDEPTLTCECTVDSDGSITFPLVGRVEVGGKTIRETENILTTLLRKDYVRRAQVSVEVKSYRSRSIFVLGEVRTPGKYSIGDQVTLLEVIANAGSLTSTAGNTIIVQRQKDPRAPVTGPALPNENTGVEIMRISYEDLKEGRLRSNIVLQDGDTLFIPEAERFFVTGFVRTPGMYVHKQGMTVQQAIAQAGGLTDRGTLRRLKILRKDKDGRDVEMDAKPTDVVMPNDTIKISQRLI
ncbi:MAG TPA: polysaccharide biosynthesis/export family protein [Vicinamibacterales bacterium]